MTQSPANWIVDRIAGALDFGIDVTEAAHARLERAREAWARAFRTHPESARPVVMDNELTRLCQEEERSRSPALRSRRQGLFSPGGCPGSPTAGGKNPGLWVGYPHLRRQARRHSRALRKALEGDTCGVTFPHILGSPWMPSWHDWRDAWGRRRGRGWRVPIYSANHTLTEVNEAWCIGHYAGRLFAVREKAYDRV